MGKKIVIALGGNALQGDDKLPTSKDQLDTVLKTAKEIIALIKADNEVVISHGNGPQVGRIVLASEFSASVTPVIPFPESVAMSQGYIGYHLQQALRKELKAAGINKEVITVITQVLVDEDDPAFQNPTKPIGPFYTEMEANILKKDRGFAMKEDAGRGYRRVVASPRPMDIIEKKTIISLLRSDVLTIAAGGGGIPVVLDKSGDLRGIPAVIDKDFASEKLAELINADILMILTVVDHAYINYRKANQKALGRITVKELKGYMEEGQFASGSMLPKIQAAIEFTEKKRGRISIITSLSGAVEAMHGTRGTIIVNE
ncbi:MAG: carbamate kinase [Eubacteriaceae bacterium]|nr:carbamate kinase [Eubacteriaceae bacterium]